MATFLEIERKKQLDAIARATFGWPDDGTRRTYSVETVIETIKELRACAAGPIDEREQAAFEQGKKSAHPATCGCIGCLNSDH